MRIVFFGSKSSSVKFLEKLIENRYYEVVSVVTIPDKPAGRGLKLKPSPVKEFAIANNLRVFTPENLKSQEFISEFSSIENLQLGIVVAYGKILPKEIFTLPKYGTINIHFSLLPKYRGAAPIQWALINGEKVTGVSVFQINEGLDTGDILVQKEVEIAHEDDAITLEQKLVRVGINAMFEVLNNFSAEGFISSPPVGEVAVATNHELDSKERRPRIEPEGKQTIQQGVPELGFSRQEKGRKQSGEPSYAPPLKKQDGKINWNKSSKEIYNLIRGTKPWPAAFTEVKSEKLKIKSVKIITAETIEICPENNFISSIGAQPGEIISIVKNQGFVVRCGSGFLLIKEVQPEGKSPMSAWDFLQGARLKIGDKFST